MTVDLRRLPMSPKQIDYTLDSDAFVNLAEGSVRAGKSIAGLIRWLMYIANEAPKTGELIVTAKTYDTAVRNVFNPLRDSSVFGPFAKATSYTRGAPTAKILGETVEVITFNDERSENRLRGMTARGTYVDEWSLMPRSFHEQLLARHSVDGAKLFGNTNPDNPRHWLKVDNIDEAVPGGRLAGDWYVLKFLLDDNPKLSEQVKERYRRQYTGLWYRRNILGEWCLAEGAVYEAWDADRHVVDELPPIVRWISVGVDYGTVNPFAALLLGVGDDGRLYLADEWRWDSKQQQRQLTDAEYSRRLRAWLEERRPWLKGGRIQPEWIAVDPSAASFKLQLFRDGVSTVMDADNDVVDGLRLIASLLATDRLRVHERCKGWIEECPGYSWDDKAAEKGEDKPVKAADHSLDAGRYAIASTSTLWRPLVRDAATLAA